MFVLWSSPFMFLLSFGLFVLGMCSVMILYLFLFSNTRACEGMLIDFLYMFCVDNCLFVEVLVWVIVGDNLGDFFVFIFLIHTTYLFVEYWPSCFIDVFEFVGALHLFILLVSVLSFWVLIVFLSDFLLLGMSTDHLFPFTRVYRLCRGECCGFASMFSCCGRVIVVTFLLTKLIHAAFW